MTGSKSYAQDGVPVVSLIRPQTATVDDAVEDAISGEIFGAYLDRVRPALVHFHCVQRLTVSVVEAARQRGIPYVITVHDGWWISDRQFVVDENGNEATYDYALDRNTSGRMAVLREPLFGATAVAAVSEKFADLYRRCGVPNVRAIPNGISAFEPARRTPRADGRVCLALIAGMTEAKGYHLVRQALLTRNFTRLHLIVIEGTLSPGTARHETWNTTPVEFLAKFPEAAVAALYARIDVLLAPSVCIESFGLVTREALHCGCWVVASNRGSIGDCITQGENGYIINVANAAALTDLLEMIDTAPETYRQSPSLRPTLRRAAEQSEDLAALYRSIIPSDRRVSAMTQAHRSLL